MLRPDALLCRSVCGSCVYAVYRSSEERAIAVILSKRGLMAFRHTEPLGAFLPLKVGDRTFWLLCQSYHRLLIQPITVSAKKSPRYPLTTSSGSRFCTNRQTTHHHPTPINRIEYRLYSVIFTQPPTRPSSSSQGHRSSRTSNRVARLQFSTSLVPHSSESNLDLQTAPSITMSLPSQVPNPSTEIPTPFKFDPVEEAVAAVKNGEFVVVMDDEDRENEGDLICAASKITEEGMAWFVRWSR